MTDTPAEEEEGFETLEECWEAYARQFLSPESRTPLQLATLRETWMAGVTVGAGTLHTAFEAGDPPEDIATLAALTVEEATLCLRKPADPAASGTKQ